jgi:hypothetical protein
MGQSAGQSLLETNSDSVCNPEAWNPGEEGLREQSNLKTPTLTESLSKGVRKDARISESCWRREELNRPLDAEPLTEKMLHSPIKTRSFSDFQDDDGGPKTAKKDPHIPEKPDPVRSVKRNPRKQ